MLSENSKQERGALQDRDDADDIPQTSIPRFVMLLLLFFLVVLTGTYFGTTTLLTVRPGKLGTAGSFEGDLRAEVFHEIKKEKGYHSVFEVQLSEEEAAALNIPSPAALFMGVNPASPRMVIRSTLARLTGGKTAREDDQIVTGTTSIWLTALPSHGSVAIIPKSLSPAPKVSWYNRGARQPSISGNPYEMPRVQNLMRLVETSAGLLSPVPPLASYLRLLTSVWVHLVTLLLWSPSLFASRPEDSFRRLAFHVLLQMYRMTLHQIFESSCDFSGHIVFFASIVLSTDLELQVLSQTTIPPGRKTHYVFVTLVRFAGVCFLISLFYSLLLTPLFYHNREDNLTALGIVVIGIVPFFAVRKKFGFKKPGNKQSVAAPQPVWDDSCLAVSCRKDV